MKTARTQLAAVPTLITALAKAVVPGGACPLEPAVPGTMWWAALTGPAAAYLSRASETPCARLVDIGWRLAGGGTWDARPAAISRVVELLHASAQIVREANDATTANAGAWVQAWALAELARLELPGAVELAIETLARVHEARSLALAIRVTDLAVHEVAGVVATTTWLGAGAMGRLATELGALAAGSSPSCRAAFGEIGEAIGCALYMLDELDCLTAATCRDRMLADLHAGRPSWPWAWLASTTDPFTWARLCHRARSGADLERLCDTLADHVYPIGRHAIRTRIDGAIANLRLVTNGADDIVAELRMLEEIA